MYLSMESLQEPKLSILKRIYLLESFDRGYCNKIPLPQVKYHLGLDWIWSKLSGIRIKGNVILSNRFAIYCTCLTISHCP